MTNTHHVTVLEAGIRLDAWLVQASSMNKTWAGKQIKLGQVHVNGAVTTKAGYLVLVNDEIHFKLPAAVKVEKSKAPLQLSVSYEDDDLLIVDKPAGLLVHPASRPDVVSVVDFARQHTTDSDSDRPGIVHRLDRDTSGLLIIAKNIASKEYLQQAFKKHDIKKHYKALVYGHLAQSEGLIDLPIDRDKKQPTKRQVAIGGRSAKTVYRTLAVYKDYSLLELEPFTGRTHQLRVHLAHIGHPIVGDTVYGPKKPSGLQLNRHFLHAGELYFVGPSGKIIEVTSPLPADLENVLAGL